MKFYLALLFAAAFNCLMAQSTENQTGPINPKLNAIPKYHSNVVDTFFGTPVPDPYRWLESLGSDSVKEWLKKEKSYTQSEESGFDNSYIGAINKMTSDQGIGFHYLKKVGAYFFQLAYTGHFSSPVLFYRKKYDSEEMLACNPVDFSTINSNPSITDYALSNDAKYLAVSLSDAGSDWQTIRIMNLNSQFPLKDRIDWVKFSNVAWWKDGFFYSRYEQPGKDEVHLAENKGQKLCYHKLGDKQESDQVVYNIPQNAKFSFRFEITPDKKYLIIYSSIKLGGKQSNIVAFKDLDGENGLFEEFQPIIMEPADSAWGGYEVIDFINGKFVVSATRGAPKGKVLLFDKTHTNAAEVLIPEYQEVLTGVHHIGGRLLCTYQGTGTVIAGIYDYEGKFLAKLNFPPGVVAHGFYGSPSDTEVFYYQNAFYCPPVVAQLNIAQNKTEYFGKTSVHFEVKNYTTDIVIYKSKDGTDIPMYLTHRKDLKMTNNNPVLLYGYGGFGVSTLPFYSFSNIIFFESGGILAVPLIRGGGEFGEQWHRDGSHLKKLNSFDDFIAAAEYLIKSGYTCKGHLAITGASNGGLLVGAMLTQRPDLFKVAIADVGAFDMLRYQLFTTGKYAEDEFGVSSNYVDFKNLLSYSPLHNLKSEVDYPATLIITSENDDRVPHLHSYKFLASLQEKSVGTNPHILYFQKDQGHNGSTTISEHTEKQSFELTFMFHQFKLPLKTGF